MSKTRTIKLFTWLSALALAAPLVDGQEAYMVAESYSRKVLIAHNSSVKRPIASLTKIATTVVTVDWATRTRVDMSKEMITIPQVAYQLSSTNNLKAGDTITLTDALYAMMLSSDNVAAYAVASHVGSAIQQNRSKSKDPIDVFVKEMNELADYLEMSSTKFTNPHGLTISKPCVSTAADLARLCIYAMRHSSISFITRQQVRAITVHSGAGISTRRLVNTNELVKLQNIIGIKTGTSEDAGSCVAVCVDRAPAMRVKADGTPGVTPRKLIVVLLNNNDRFARAKELINGGWKTYDYWLSQGAPVVKKRKEILNMPEVKGDL